jgi:hypothetical protein
LSDTKIEVIKSEPILPFFIKEAKIRYTEVKEGKLVLKPVTDLKYVVDEKVELNIMYKGQAVALVYNIKIAPDYLSYEEILNSSKSAMAESSHFVHHYANNNPLVIKANTTNSEIDITDMLFESTVPLPKGFELTINFAGVVFGGAPNDRTPSKYLEVRNNRVYLKPGVPSRESKENVDFILKYKYAEFNGTNTALWITIQP